jgi:hypothetical protein
MKQRKPLQRRTRLVATAGLSRSTRLASSGPVKARRSVGLTAAERTAKAIVVARAEGRCEIGVLCRRGPGIDFSHRWAEGQGGPYLPSNGLLACRLDHQMLHANPDHAKTFGWFIQPTWRLAPGGPAEPVAPGEVPAWLWRAGGWGPEWVWLDDRGGLRPVGYDELDAVLKDFGLERFA